ncbi:unknown [Prevotella sp. CAG:604]|nr:unknown [Prevotella sp. CAG:604]
MMTGTAGEISWVIISYFLGDSLLLKHLAHFFTLEMDGRHHDMAWFLTQELDNALTQVSFHYINTMLFQIRIHLTLFGKHRL